MSTSSRDTPRRRAHDERVIPLLDEDEVGRRSQRRTQGAKLVRRSERVPGALHEEHRDVDRAEVSVSALLRALGRVQRVAEEDAAAYQGDPAKFAWVVPMQRAPEVSAGSQALFDRILQATVPSYGFTTQRDQCSDDGPFSRGAASSGDTSFLEGGEDDGVDVLFQKTVGAFEIAALQGGTAEEVVAWLDQNGYQLDEDAPAILGRYVERQFVFVAIKLTAGAGLDEIHPIVFSYSGDEPCVPLELTAIAAVPDMGVRTFFLGHASFTIG